MAPVSLVPSFHRGEPFFPFISHMFIFDPARLRSGVRLRCSKMRQHEASEDT